MQKKNLIYIIGGAAIVGYFLYMKKKKSQAEIITPDQQIAPAFVNQPTDKIKETAKKISRRGAPALSRRGKKILSEKTVVNEDGGKFIVRELMPVPGGNRSQIDSSMLDNTAIMEDSSVQSIIPLGRKDARQSARSTKKEIIQSGGTRKEGRQAARSVRRDNRSARKMGDLPVMF